MNLPLRLALCEDCSQDMDLLLFQIKKTGVNVSCQRFSSGGDLLESFLPGKYDLIFLDIYMEGIRGLEVGQRIREADRKVMLAFITSSTDHTLESYRMKASAYLEKPAKEEDLREILLLAQAKRDLVPSITLLIDSKNRDIPTDDILFFECQNHAINVHTQYSLFRTSQSMRIDQIEPLLPDHFFRCHHSYIINLQYVKDLNQSLSIFIMEDDSMVHIRRKDLKKAIKSYENYLFKKVREN